jgi:hypothetical protein
MQPIRTRCTHTRSPRCCGRAVLGRFIVARYDPGPTLEQIVVTPWVCAQVARCDLGVRLRHGVPLAMSPNRYPYNA